jgi:nickel-dependent lactate racemase
MAIIFATGIHRPVTEKERVELLSPFIARAARKSWCFAET